MYRPDTIRGKVDCSAAARCSDLEIICRLVSDKIIGQMIDRPGEFSIKQNQPNQENTINSVCNSGCNGVAIVSNWAPITNLTEKPQPTTENPYLCCNAQRKAKRRAIYASTNLKKNYYTTTMSKLYNRCKTFEQKQFKFSIDKLQEILKVRN